MSSHHPHGDWPDRAEPYWRRRVLVLGGVIAVVGLIMWGCSATGPVAAPQQAASDAAQQGSSAATATPAAAAGVTSAATPAASPTGRPAKRQPAEKRSMAKKKRVVKKHATTRASSRGTCAAGDLVISLTESRQSYPQPDKPRFTIYVVNTGRRTCTLDVSPRSLRLVVESGPVHSWSPADCARGSGPDLVRLAHGVPLVQQVSWNRVRSEPGCPMPRVNALPGTYTVRVMAGPVHSRVDVFLLR